MDNMENKPKRRNTEVEAQDPQEVKAGKPKTGFRIFKLLTVVIILLAVLVYFGVPYAVSTEQFKKFIVDKVESEGATLRYSTLKFSWTKGVDATNVVYHDATGETNAEIANVKGHVHYLPLLKKEIVLKDVMLNGADVSMTIKDDEMGEPAVYHAGETDIPKTVVCGDDFEFSLTGITAKISDSRFRISTLINTKAITNLKVELLRLTHIEADINIDKPGKPSKLDVSMNILADEKSYPVTLKSDFMMPKNGIPETLDLQCNIDKLDMAVLQPVATILQVPVKLSGVVELNIDTQIKDKTVQHFTANSNSSNFKVKSEADNVKDVEIKSIAGNISLRGDKDFLYLDRFYCSTDFGTIDIEGKIAQKEFDFKTFSDIANFALNGSLDIDIKKMLDTLMVKEQPAESFNVKSGRLLGSFNVDNQDSGTISYSKLSLNDFSASSKGELIKLSKPVEFVSKFKLDQEYNIKSIDTVSLTSDFFEIKSTGTLDTADFSADVDITGINKFIRFATGKDQPTFAGRFTSSGTINSDDDVARFEGSANVKDFMVQDKTKKINIIEPDIKSTFLFSLPMDDFTEEEYRVEDFRLECAAGTLRLFDIGIQPEDEKYAGSFDANLSLDKIFDWVKLFKSELREYSVIGNLTASGKASAKHTKYELSLDKSNIEKLSVVSDTGKIISQENVYADLDVTFDSSNKTLKTLKGGVVRLDGIKVDIAALELANDGTNQSVNADVTADYDLLRLNEDFIYWIPENLKDIKISGKDKLALKLKGSWPTQEPKKMPESVAGNISLGFEGINGKGINVGASKIKAAINAGILDVEPLSVPINEGAINADMQVNFNNKLWPLTVKTPVRLVDNIYINEESSREMMQMLNPALASSARLSGYVTADLTKFSMPLHPDSAGMDAAEIEGSYQINDVKFSSSPQFDGVLKFFGLNGMTANINVLPTDFNLRAGKMSYNQMVMNIDNVPFELSGSVDSENHMDFLLTLPLTLSGDIVGMNQLKDDPKRLEIPMSGQMPNPSINIESIIRQQAASKVESLIKGTLGGNQKTEQESDTDTSIEELLRKGFRSIFD